MKISTCGDDGHIGMKWTWKCLQSAYLLCMLFVIFCTSPQQVLRSDLNLVYEIDNAFHTTLTTRRWDRRREEELGPVHTQMRYNYLLFNNGCLNPCWIHIVFLLKPTGIYEKEFTFFATNRAWTFNGVLLLIPYRSIYHARIFIPKPNHPFWTCLNMLSTQMTTRAYKDSLTYDIPNKYQDFIGIVIMISIGRFFDTSMDVDYRYHAFTHIPHQ